MKQISTCPAGQAANAPGDESARFGGEGGSDCQDGGGLECLGGGLGFGCLRGTQRLGGAGHRSGDGGDEHGALRSGDRVHGPARLAAASGGELINGDVIGGADQPTASAGAAGRGVGQGAGRGVSQRTRGGVGLRMCRQIWERVSLSGNLIARFYHQGPCCSHIFPRQPNFGLFAQPITLD